MLLNKFHARQTSISSEHFPIPKTSLHQRRDSVSLFSSHQQHASFDEEKTPPSTPIKDLEPAWSNMPHKLQLTILALSRLVDFWQIASLQSYMVQQLHSFDTGLAESTISHQAGILQGSFTAAQIVTSILWGRAADSPFVGRKNVLLIGLIGTGMSCIGVGFSSTFWQAAVWRLLGGAVNGTVGSARTMVAETVHARWHSRAFLLLPVAFNVANIVGPVIGGLLVNPISTYPSLFEGRTGIWWMESYPYALPSLLCALLLFIEAALVAAFLNETLPFVKDAHSFSSQFINMYHGIISILRGRRGYTALQQQESCLDNRLPSLSGHTEKHVYHQEQARPLQRLPFSRIWTANVLWTLLSVAIFDFHMGAFSGLWIIFLSTSRTATTSPRGDSTNPSFSSIHVRPHPRLSSHDAIHFAGGLSFQPALLGTSLAILGIIGLLFQVALYPWANGRFGLMKCFRYSLTLFPLAYFLAPYIALLPSTTPAPLPASGTLVWLGISIVLTLQVTARTFALPASIILVNNASPHPSVLGTIHGVGQSVSSTFRTVGPIAAGYWYGIGLEKGVVCLSWWTVAAISALGCVASLRVKNGTGHEIMLPGEEQDMDEE